MDENKMNNDAGSKCGHGDECKESSDCKESGEEHSNKSKLIAIETRPNASPGYWLCLLLPTAMTVSYARQKWTQSPPPCDDESTAIYEILVAASLGMCIESLCLLLWLRFQTSLVLEVIMALGPGIFTTILCHRFFSHAIEYQIAWAFAVTYVYHFAYMKTMRSLPRCFSYGEACILVQGFVLFLLDCLARLKLLLIGEYRCDSDFENINTIMMNALFILAMVSLLLSYCPLLRSACCFYLLLAVYVMAVTMVPVTSPLPVFKLFAFIWNQKSRMLIVGFYSTLALCSVFAVAWQLTNKTKASTRIRKIFHVLAVLVYVPGLLYQCTLLYMASGIALATLTILDLVRIHAIPPLGDALKNSFAIFSDAKDAGVIAVTPFCLLIGISLPIWLQQCPCGGDSVSSGDLLPLMSGILSVGIGDTMASIIGSKCGRHKWKNSSRTLEGSAAFIISIILSVYILYIGDYVKITTIGWSITILATIITALVEALTNQIDNLVLPLVFFIIVRVY